MNPDKSAMHLVMFAIVFDRRANENNFQLVSLLRFSDGIIANWQLFKRASASIPQHNSETKVIKTRMAIVLVTQRAKTNTEHHKSPDTFYIFPFFTSAYHSLHFSIQFKFTIEIYYSMHFQNTFFSNPQFHSISLCKFESKHSTLQIFYFFEKKKLNTYWNRILSLLLFLFVW